jgi:hypothetical protein
LGTLGCVHTPFSVVMACLLGGYSVMSSFEYFYTHKVDLRPTTRVTEIISSSKMAI